MAERRHPDLDVGGPGVQGGSTDSAPGSAAGQEIPVVRYRQALTYISSPTMGLPPGRDALDFVDEASEDNVRLALKACIGTARAALND